MPGTEAKENARHEKGEAALLHELGHAMGFERSGQDQEDKPFTTSVKLKLPGEGKDTSAPDITFDEQPKNAGGGGGTVDITDTIQTVLDKAENAGLKAKIEGLKDVEISKATYKCRTCYVTITFKKKGDL